MFLILLLFQYLYIKHRDNILNIKKNHYKNTIFSNIILIFLFFFLNYFTLSEELQSIHKYNSFL